MIVWIKYFIKEKCIQKHKMTRHRRSWLVIHLTTELFSPAGSVILHTTVWHLIQQLLYLNPHSPLVCVSEGSCSQRSNHIFKSHLKFYFAAGIICKCFSLVFLCIKIWQAFSDIFFLFIMEVRWCFVTKEPYQHTLSTFSSCIHANWVLTSQLKGFMGETQYGITQLKLGAVNAFWACVFSPN